MAEEWAERRFQSNRPIRDLPSPAATFPRIELPRERLGVRSLNYRPSLMENLSGEGAKTLHDGFALGFREGTYALVRRHAVNDFKDRVVDRILEHEGGID